MWGWQRRTGYTTEEKTKLSNLDENAEANVQSDWNEVDTTADSFIKNKPTIPEPMVFDSTLDNMSENAVQNKNRLR